jgi:hypothetical protein
MQEQSSVIGRPRRRIFRLGVAAAILMAGYTAGWFWLAQKIESETGAALASLRERGINAECANPVTRGFPFRIGLFCDHVAFEQPAGAVSVSAGALRSTGQIYDPMLLTAEVDSPATVTAPGTGTLSLDWKDLRASARLGTTTLPKRVSLHGSALQVAAAGKPLGSAETFEAHMRPNGDDLDLSARFAGLALDPATVDGRNIPPLSGKADLSLAGAARMIIDGARDLRGRSGVVRNLSITLGPKGSLALSGPFSVGADGLIDANLKVAITEPNALAASLEKVFPEEADKISQGFAGLAFLGSKPTLPLKISKGAATLGFIRLGKIPPLR